MPRWYFLLGLSFAAAACRTAIGIDDLSFSDEGPNASSSGPGGSQGGQGGTQTSSSSGDIGQGGSAGSSSGSSGGGEGGGTIDLLMIPCGAKPCMVDSTHACCWNILSQTGECVSGGAGQDGCNAQQGLSRIECHTSEDCPTSQVCCAKETTIGQTSFYSSSSCESTCLYPNIVLCDQLGEMEPGCPPAFFNGMFIPTQCQPVSILPQGYLACGPLGG